MTALTGPVTGGRRGFPFSVGVEAPPGYVLEEYLLDGDATGFAPRPETGYEPTGRWTAEPDRSAPFRSRFLVLRPADPRRFTGTVVVSWQNVTAGFELAMPPVDLAELGIAWVGVTAQRVAIEGFPEMGHLALRGWDAERYGDLQHPGDDFSFDIFTQAARLVGPDRERHLAGQPDPLGGLPVVRSLATGSSQSALRLRTYVNALQPIEHAFDGFLLTLDIGSGALLDTTGLDLSVPLRIPQAHTRIRDDLDVPVFVVNSETEVPRLFPVRQPDDDRFRLWEVAGTAHIGFPGLGTEATLRQLDVHELPAEVVPQGRAEDTNLLSHAPVQRAAFRSMLRWLTEAVPPPAFPLVEVAGDPPAIVRDGAGNALGGVRLPDLEVPIAAHSGVREDEPDVLRRIAGYSRPFHPDRLRSRYRGLQDYLDRYGEALDASIAAGAVVPEDRRELLRTAAARAGTLVTW